MPRKPLLRHPAIDRALREGDRPLWAMGSAEHLERPEHIAKIGECLTLWPDVETQLGLLLAALTKADAAATVAVYSILRRSTSKTAAIKAAADTWLDQRGKEFLAALLSVVETVEGQRNDLAHGHWGVSQHIPDAILWLDGSHTLNFHVMHRQKVVIERTNLVFDLNKKIYYYKVKDFDEIIDAMNKICETIFEFRAFLDHARGCEPFYTASELIDRLVAYAPIGQALAQIRGASSAPKKPKPARRQPKPD